MSSSSGDSVRRLIWLLPIVVGLPAIAVYFLLPPESQNILYEAFGVGATLAVVAGILIHRPPHARVWLLLAVGFGLWTCGDIVSAVIAPDGGDIPVPSFADAWYLAGYAVLIIAVARLAGPVFRASAMERPALLDALILATTAGIGVWLLVVNPLLAADELALPTAIVSAAYPVLDTLIILVVARHLLISGPKPQAAILLTAGLTCYLVADLVNIGESLAGTYSASGSVNMGWLLAYVLVAAASLHPSVALVGVSDGELHAMSVPRRLMLASAAVMPAVVIVAQDSSRASDRIVLAVGTALLVGVVLLRLFGALRDQQALREAIFHESRHDHLTGLGNRAMFSEQLRVAVGGSRRGVGLLYLDVDDFKIVNDTMGHDAGDELLRSVAERLRLAVRGTDNVARLGGDEFAVLVPDAATEEAVAIVATRVLNVLGGIAPMRGSVVLTVSVGVAWLPGATASASELLRRADVAMYAAKRARLGMAIYRAPMDGLRGGDEEVVAPARRGRGVANAATTLLPAFAAVVAEGG